MKTRDQLVQVAVIRIIAAVLRNPGLASPNIVSYELKRLLRADDRRRLKPHRKPVCGAKTKMKQILLFGDS